MLFNIRPLAPITAPPIDFSGDMLHAIDGENWEAAFLEGGTIRFDSDPGSVDVFLAANGNPGGTKNRLNDGVGKWAYYSGAGGEGGGWIKATVTMKPGVDYVLTIGDTATLVGDEVILSTANGQAGSSGGKRAMLYMTNVEVAGRNPNGSINWHAQPGSPGIFAYNDAYDRTIIPEFRGKRFCAGGGAGDAFWFAGNVIESTDNSGGATDGGRGAWYRSASDNGAAVPGADNSASGGGGERYSFDGGSYNSPAAAGGSGVCFIRKHLEG